MFESGRLVPLMRVAPKSHVLLPSETATALLPGGSEVELLDASLLQPTITIVADMAAMMIAFFIRRDAAKQPGSLAASRWVEVSTGPDPRRPVKPLVKLPLDCHDRQGTTQCSHTTNTPAPRPFFSQTLGRSIPSVQLSSPI